MNYIKLCHPGISRMTAFARDRNLKIRKMTSSCSSYKACKPRFLKVKKVAQRFGQWILTTQSLMSFQGFISHFCIQYWNKNYCFKALWIIFDIWDVSMYRLYSDKGSSFMSTDLKLSVSQNMIPRLSSSVSVDVIWETTNVELRNHNLPFHINVRQMNI